MDDFDDLESFCYHLADKEIFDMPAPPTPPPKEKKRYVKPAFTWPRKSNRGQYIKSRRR